MACALFVGCDSGGDTPTAADADETSSDARVTPSDVMGRADVPGSEPWVRIGTGSRNFVELEPGQEIPIVAGIQGGFHVWGAFLAGGFPGTDSRIDFSLTVDGAELAAAHYSEPVIRRIAGDMNYGGVSVVFADNDDVEPNSGRTMVLSLRVEDGDGTVLTDEIEVVPVCCE